MTASVDEFLEIVADLFKNIASVVEETFNDTTPRTTRSSTTTTGGGGGGESQSPAGPPALEADGSAVTGQVVHQPAMKSFKFLEECPASIVFIFQTYRPMVNKAIATFVPLVFDVSFSFPLPHDVVFRKLTISLILLVPTTTSCTSS
jgi:transformation/transcription domain-associated protein